MHHIYSLLHPSYDYCQTVKQMMTDYIQPQREPSHNTMTNQEDLLALVPDQPLAFGPAPTGVTRKSSSSSSSTKSTGHTQESDPYTIHDDSHHDQKHQKDKDADQDTEEHDGFNELPKSEGGKRTNLNLLLHHAATRHGLIVTKENAQAWGPRSVFLQLTLLLKLAKTEDGEENTRHDRTGMLLIPGLTRQQVTTWDWQSRYDHRNRVAAQRDFEDAHPEIFAFAQSPGAIELTQFIDELFEVLARDYSEESEDRISRADEPKEVIGHWKGEFCWFLVETKVDPGRTLRKGGVKVKVEIRPVERPIQWRRKENAKNNERDKERLIGGGERRRRRKKWWTESRSRDMMELSDTWSMVSDA